MESDCRGEAGKALWKLKHTLSLEVGFHLAEMRAGVKRLYCWEGPAVENVGHVREQISSACGLIT